MSCINIFLSDILDIYLYICYYVVNKLEKRPKKTQDFCTNAKKRRRHVPEGTPEGADEAVVQKDKFYGTVFGFVDYSFRRWRYVKNLRIKAARAAKDMTQKDLAKAVGVARQTMNAIEKGDYNPSIKLCISISRVLGKTLDELFWEDDNGDD